MDFTEFAWDLGETNTAAGAEGEDESKGAAESNTDGNTEGDVQAATTAPPTSQAATFKSTAVSVGDDEPEELERALDQEGQASAAEPSQSEAKAQHTGPSSGDNTNEPGLTVVKHSPSAIAEASDMLKVGAHARRRSMLATSASSGAAAAAAAAAAATGDGESDGGDGGNIGSTTSRAEASGLSTAATRPAAKPSDDGVARDSSACPPRVPLFHGFTAVVFFTVGVVVTLAVTKLVQQ